MKTQLALLSLVLFSSSAIAAVWPKLTATFGNGGTPSETISQSGCQSVTFTSYGSTQTVYTNGTIHASGDGEYDKYQWLGRTLVATPVTPDGQTIPGLTTVYSLTAAGDLSIRMVIKGTAGNANVLKRIK